jgi:glycosyltransferase involved in cell wall biosynthesis
LESVLGQSYPADRLEVLVYDGASTDGSWDIAARVLAARPGAHLRPNERRIQAAAWNLGIEAAIGDVIGILSGHAILGREYVAAAVEVLRRTGADMVGGPVRAIGDGPTARAIALASSLPFGVGGARFRYLDREEEVDTVFMGLSPQAVYRAFRFDEEMVRNQDDELSYRLLDAGARIVCSPRIESWYRSRTTLGGLWRQYFYYGSWKVRVLQKHPGQVRLRHLVPTAFVASVIGGVALALVWPTAWAGVAAIGVVYGAAMTGSIVMARGRESVTALALLPAAFVVMHVAYGIGVVVGLARHRRWEPGSVSRLAGRLLRRARR